MAATVWAACNLFIGELVAMGVGGIFYFNTGSLIFTGGYFIRRCCQASDPAAASTPSILWFIAGAILQGAIILAITLTFVTSKMADLNPGIASTIWCI
jgi:hypothetical protein